MPVDKMGRKPTQNQPQPLSTKNSQLKHTLIPTLIHRLIHTNFLKTAPKHEVRD